MERHPGLGVPALGVPSDAAGTCGAGDRAAYQDRYPEMEVLGGAAAGHHLGRGVGADAPGAARSGGHLGTAPTRRVRVQKYHYASRQQPVTYVVFDLLAHDGRSLLGQPLQARRALLQELLARWQEPRLQFSEGIVGPGQVFFEQAVRQGQEGVMAKHLASRYRPGKRSSCWLKIKPARRLPCVVIGWQPGVCGLRGLLVAAPWGDVLRYVANVRTGFSDQDRRRLPAVLAGRAAASPAPGALSAPGAMGRAELFVPGPLYLEWTSAGRLRGASFHSFIPRSTLKNERTVSSTGKEKHGQV